MATTLRWLFWFSAFVTVLVAIATSTGRMLVPWLDSLEPQVNTLLAARGVELRGLDGDWRGLNPIFRVESVRFNGGHASEFEFELDLVESALHSALVARRLSAESVELTLVRNAEGTWQLGGLPARGLPFAIDALLAESDAISLPDVRLRFYQEQEGVKPGATGADADPWKLLGDFDVEVVTRNEGGRHQGVLGIRLAGSACTSCGLDARFDFTEAVLGLGGAGEATLVARDLPVAPELGVALGAVGGTLATVDGQWRLVDGVGRGALQMAARDVRFATGALDALAFRVDADTEDARWRARVTDLSARPPGGRPLETPELDGGGEWSDDAHTLELTVASLDLGALADTLRSALGGVAPVETWLVALDLGGRAEDVQLRGDLDEGELSYSARVLDLSMENFKGVPQARRADASVVGFEHGVQVAIDEDDMVLGFLDVFERVSEFRRVQGSLFVWFGDGYLGIRGWDLDVATATAEGRGAFVVARPDDPLEIHLAILADVAGMAVDESRHYVPDKLSKELVGWVRDALVAGDIERARVAYQGHIRALPGKAMRHAEVVGDVRNGTIRFHHDWPAATELDGSVEVSQAGTRVVVASGRVLAANLIDTTVFVPRDGSRAEVEGLARLGAPAALQLIHETPLAEWLPQVETDWSASGALEVALDLVVPLRPDAAPLEVGLAFDLEDVTLGLGAIGLTLENLTGPVTYRHPYVVSAAPLRGALFGRPATYSAETVDGAVRLHVAGHVGTDELIDWLAIPDHGLAQGSSDFDATFVMAPEASPWLEVTSELEGIAIDLPAPFRKTADEPRPTELVVGFEADYTSLAMDWEDLVAGWVNLRSGGGPTGFVRLGANDQWIPPQQRDREELMVVGRLESADLGDWSELLPLVSGGDEPGVSWATPGLEIGRAYRGGVAFDDLLIDGRGSEGAMTVAVDGPQIKGQLDAPPDGPMQLTVEFIAFPEGDEDAGDPLAGIDLSGVPDVDVRVDEILVGESSYGTWDMKVRRDDGAFVVSELVADVKGLHVESTGPARWSPDGENRSHFEGDVSAGNLAEVLPLWDYAATIESKSAQVSAALDWPGSPLNFSMWHASGTLDVDIAEGRFLDVSGAADSVRIFGLFNLAALAKRMTLDFSDVFGKGISFDEVTAKTELVDGLMTFTEPMLVVGTGGRFRLVGSVDLESGSLDNEMVVTLPVSASLPWYAAYLSVFANPIIGGAVFFGERLLRDQIDSFSSAKYKIDGTLDQPVVSFVQVFPTTTEAAAPSAATEPPPTTEQEIDDAGD